MDWTGESRVVLFVSVHGIMEEQDKPSFCTVGAAFDFVAGTKPQAPRWMMRIGLEWALPAGIRT